MYIHSICMHQQLRICRNLVLESWRKCPGTFSNQCKRRSLSKAKYVLTDCLQMQSLCQIGQMDHMHAFRFSSKLLGMRYLQWKSIVESFCTNPRWPAMISREKWKWWRCDAWTSHLSLGNNWATLQTTEVVMGKLHPGKLTWNLKITSLKMSSSKPPLLCSMLIFQGVLWFEDFGLKHRLIQVCLDWQ